jgi:PAS domain S-box-containing protein
MGVPRIPLARLMRPRRIQAENTKSLPYERPLKAILDGMPDGVVVFDAGGGISFSSAAACRLLRTSAIGATLPEWARVCGFYRPDMRTPFPAAELPPAAVLRGEKPGAAEVYVRHERASGGAWLSVSAFPIEFDDFRGAAAILRDISEQRRARDEAQESRRRLQFLADATAILGSSLDYETTVAQIARLAVPHMADWCAVDMLEPDGSMRQLALAHVNPVKIERVRELRRQYPPDPKVPHGAPEVLRTGQPELIEEISENLLRELARSEEHLRLIRELGFGSYMCVPVIARGRALGVITFVSAESGRKYGAADLEIAQHLARRTGLAIDNARLYEAAHRAREAAEESLEASRRSEQHFRRLVESGIIGIVLGEGDTITEANTVFLDMLGYSRDELAAGRLRWPDLTPSGHARADAHAAEEASARSAFSPYEKELTHRNGTRVPVLIGGAILEGPPYQRWVAFVLDLTERKHLERRLKESQKLESIGLLAGGIAHDFNNLLTGIMGNASLALDGLPADDPRRPVIENVVRASEKAAHLTRQLLAYSGKGRFVIQTINLSELVSEISALLRTSIPKKVELRLDIREDLPPIEGDSSQIQQLIMNMVLNGAEAIGETIGTVLVTTGVQEVDEEYIRKAALHEGIVPGSYVYLEVHDTGCGMDEQTRARIFDPFFTTKFTGRGLGLAAAIGIVRGHNGDIKVYSSPGRGSTFKVLLPRAAGGYEQTPPTQVQELRGSGTIMVVDDEEIVRQTARIALERYGYKVLTAENGMEAIEAFRPRAEEISAVLLDMTMPVMSGEETLEKLVAIRPGVRVIVSSGYNEVEAVRRFTGTGAAAFIQKPYTSAQLAERMKAVLEGKAAGLGSGS